MEHQSDNREEREKHETKPVLGETKPMMGETKPMVGETKPMVGETKPMVGETKPMMGEEKPSSAATRSESDSEPFNSRIVEMKVLAVEQTEGVGSRVRRSIGGSKLKNFDPFLMLDEFRVRAPAGFPDHPHRGFETVTYILPSSKGTFRHEDFCGHKGEIGRGDVQWMTAGRGMVHSEMPTSSEDAHGLQLWINLPSKDKLCEPQYQELKTENVPQILKDGITAIVIAGSALGIESKMYTRTPTHYIHFMMQKNTTLRQPIPQGWNSFLYILSGEAYVGGQSGDVLCDAHHTVVLSKNGNGIVVQTRDEATEFVLVSGKPLEEEIVQYGPFVMNTEDEIEEAIADYRQGKNGFERAQVWLSSNMQK